MKGESVKNELLRKEVEILLALFHVGGGKLLHEGKRYVPRKATPSIMQLAYNANTAGHFGYL